jgi:hypothetical protein
MDSDKLIQRSERLERIAQLLDDAAAQIQLMKEQGVYLDRFSPGEGQNRAKVADELYTRRTRECLSLFMDGEEDAKFWTAVEFYAAYVEPALDGVRMGFVETLPRSRWIRQWAEGRRTQPRYNRGEPSPGSDVSRHEAVPPNTEYPVGFVI